jgi:Rrf2 family protein
MHLTRQSDYAIRAILHLARLPYGDIVQTKEIAIAEDIPRKYLPSIIRTLARSGLIRTLRGNQGGVMLSRPPEEINLNEVVEAIEGPMALVQCLRGQEDCVHEKDCAVLPVWEGVQQMLQGQLENTTFADLTSGTKVNPALARKKNPVRKTGGRSEQSVS